MNIDERLLEVKTCKGEGYNPCVDFGEWRVALLRYIDDLKPENIEFMECHNETDETFILLQGKCILFIGDGANGVENISSIDMHQQTIYNVKKGVYHTHVLSRDALLVIVENRNTGLNNSSRVLMAADQRSLLLSMAAKLWEVEPQ